MTSAKLVDIVGRPLVKQVRTQVRFARARGLPATLTAEQWSATVAHFGGLCAYCGAAPMTSLDHYIPAQIGGGATAGNAVPCCRGCNGCKSGAAPEVFEARFSPVRVKAILDYLATASTGPNVGAVPDRTKLTNAHRKAKMRTLTLDDATWAEVEAQAADRAGATGRPNVSGTITALIHAATPSSRR